MTEPITQPTPQIAKGLEGVVVSETQLSHVNGEASKLSYRGIDINELAQDASYEEAVYLLWYGELPTKRALAEFTRALARHRRLPEGILDLIRSFPKRAHPMDVLRSAVSALALHDPELEDASKEANLRKGMRLVAVFPTIIGAFHRLRNGKRPFEPKKNLSHAANFLYLLSGKPPGKFAEEVLNSYLVLLADHGLNASTFAARVTVSTLSDIYAAVTSAIGTLKGSLHGGANEKTMELLRSIGEIEKVDEMIQSLLANRQKIPGFGHRIYRVEDPRATVFREISRRVTRETGNGRWFQISEKVEEVMQRQKRIACNVDFYSATALYSIGIPVDLFTTVFAASRVAGWVAHVLEQLADNRLIRPEAFYTGAVNRPYLPLSKRGRAGGK